MARPAGKIGVPENLRYITASGRSSQETERHRNHRVECALASHYHAVVWIDHREARVICFNADDADEKTVHPAHPPRHSRHTSGSPAGTHERGEATYYRGVANALAEVKEFLVAGPATAKKEFMTWLRGHARLMTGRLCGVETLPQMTDRELVAEARRIFKGADRMRPRTT